MPETAGASNGSDRRKLLGKIAGVLTGAAALAMRNTQAQQTSPTASLFDGFKNEKVQTTGATINVVTGGQGPPLLLLHGHPQTHAEWHKIAPALGREFTLVMADLRGYGDSSNHRQWRHDERGEKSGTYDSRSSRGVPRSRSAPQAGVYGLPAHDLAQNLHAAARHLSSDCHS